MELEKITKEILSNIDMNIKNNPSFKEILKHYFRLIKGVKSHYRIDLSEELYSKVGKNYENAYPFTMNDIILNIDYVENMDSGKIIGFTIQKKENYKVTLMVSDENNISKVICIEIEFLRNETKWKVGTERVNDEGFYYEYKYNIIKYDKTHKQINKKYDTELDKDFSDFFNIPLENARNCRLNFQDNEDYINNCKKIGVMSKLDSLYCGEKILFGEVYKFEDLDDYFLDFGSKSLEDEYEDYDEEELENLDLDEETEEDETLLGKYENALAKLDKIKKNIKSVTGTTGEFVMTQNLVINITAFLKNNDEILNTKGFIIRKINNDYTLYFVNIMNNGITKISKNVDLEQIKEMYYSHEFNKNIYGLVEFFQISNNNKLKLE